MLGTSTAGDFIENMVQQQIRYESIFGEQAEVLRADLPVVVHPLTHLQHLRPSLTSVGTVRSQTDWDPVWTRPNSMVPVPVPVLDFPKNMGLLGLWSGHSNIAQDCLRPGLDWDHSTYISTVLILYLAHSTHEWAASVNACKAGGPLGTTGHQWCHRCAQSCSGRAGALETSPFDLPLIFLSFDVCEVQLRGTP